MDFQVGYFFKKIILHNANVMEILLALYITIMNYKFTPPFRTEELIEHLSSYK